MFIFKEKKGFTLLELLAAIVVLVIGVISIIPLFTKANLFTSSSKYATIIALLAQRKVEEVKITKVFEDEASDFSQQGYADIFYELKFIPQEELGNIVLLELTLNWQEDNRLCSEQIVTYVTQI